MNLNYGAAFGYFLKDRSWVRKFAVASLLTYSVIGIGPVLGWTLEITQRVLNGQAAELPDWTDIRALWKTGLKYWLINLTWLLPALLSTLILDLPLILARSIDPKWLLLSLLASLCGELIFLTIYGMVVIFLLPAAMGILAGTGSLGKAINPASAWKQARAHLGPHVVVFFILGIGLTTVLSILVPLTLCLALPPLLVYNWMVMAHYAGQLYQLSHEDTPQ